MKRPRSFRRTLLRLQVLLDQTEIQSLSVCHCVILCPIPGVCSKMELRMKSVRITTIILLTISNLFTFAQRAVPSQRGDDTSMVHIIGLVLDVNNSRIVGARINFENANLKRQLRSDDEGRFEIKLPAGTYQITAEQRGFKTFQLSGFRANARMCELVNIHMEMEPPKSTLKVRPV